MSFEVDRYPSAWAHIALCADLTWATEPPDEFIIANQRLWAQHCRVSQALQDSSLESQSQVPTNNQCDTDRRLSQSPNQENVTTSSRKSVKDVIPESRLAQFYGNFYYDDVREKCYTNPNEKASGRGYNGQGCENSDLTECWMLPEVEYWFRKLLDEPAERGVFPRRRRQYRMLADDDFHRSAASERWGPVSGESGEEAALAARVRGVRGLWGGLRTASPPPPPRKMRARRRQPRRLPHLAPPLAYCLDAPAPLMCDPTAKFQFDAPRPPQLTECQRAMGRLSASVQAVIRATAARCPPYRGTNVSRYAPTNQRVARGPDRRHGLWWPRDHPSPRLEHRFHLAQIQQAPTEPEKPTETNNGPTNKPEIVEEKEETKEDAIESKPETSEAEVASVIENPESPRIEKPQKEIVLDDGQTASTSTAVAMENGLRKKRLYSTVLSMSAPAPINLAQVGCVRMSQKIVTPGLLKLNPKIVMPSARIRPNNERQFEELEKEALEQYKASDESIDTKFRELEKQAVEQYSTSNSNTSCSSGNSAEKQRANTSPTSDNNNTNNTKKQPANFQKEKAVDSVVIYSQNFPDLNASKGQSSNTSLKNFHTPPRGEKKEQPHRPNKNLRSIKSEPQKAASDTDYDARGENFKGAHKGPMRWMLHMVPPKKRHLSMCVSDLSSDEELEEAPGSIKDAGPCLKSHAVGKMKMSAHGGGDLRPIMRKT